MPSLPAVVLTRESADNQPLKEILVAQGITVIECPCVETSINAYDGAVLQHGLQVEDFAAVVFTSRRGVLGMAKVAERLGRNGQRLAAVGPATARELQKATGVAVDLVPNPHTGEALARLLVPQLGPGEKVLWVRGNKSSGTFQTVLQGAGVQWVELVVYTNLPTDVPPLELPVGAAIVFASPSAVRRYFKANRGHLWDTQAVAIGTTTRNALLAAGHEQVVVCKSTDVEHLAETIVNL
jgi:uroporphyrinogen-III synthase